MGGRVYPDGTDRLTSREWEDLIITTALILGYEDGDVWRGDYWQRERWRRASKWLWVEKGMHVRYNGTIFVREGVYDDGQSGSDIPKPPPKGTMPTQSKISDWYCR